MNVMDKRLQTVGDDTVLEITETKPSKTRLSEKTLTRQKQYLEQTIAHFQEALSGVDAGLAMIAAAKYEEGKK